MLRGLTAGVLLACALVAQAAPDVKTYIPVNAYKYLPMMSTEVKRIIPEIPSVAYVGSLIEQESCQYLTHKRCWDPSSELKTAREQGVGLGMVTRAYKADGSLRFDALKEIRDKNSAELKELSWLTVKVRPDLQIRAMVLMINASYDRLFQVKDPWARLAMTDAAYNGGDGGVSKERLQCGLTKGCDPQQWFGHVEMIKIKSQKPIYGTRSPYFINREHVENDLHLRLPKYEAYFKTSENAK